jgi:hypothetical protein
MFEPIYNLEQDHINRILANNGRNGQDISDFWLGIFSNEHINADKYNTNDIRGDIRVKLSSGKMTKIHTKLLQKMLDNCYTFNIPAEYSDDLQFLKKNIKKLPSDKLSRNLHAIPLLEKYPHKIDWCELLGNENAVHLFKNKDIGEILKKSQNIVEHIRLFFENKNASELIETYVTKHIEKGIINHISTYSLDELSYNPNMVSFLEKHPELIRWTLLSGNPNAVHFLEKNLDKVSWLFLSSNPNAIHILEQNLNKIAWGWLSDNPNAIQLLEQHLDKINWCQLCKNPNATKLLKENHNMIKNNCRLLSFNPSEDAIELIKENLDTVDIIALGRNPNVLKIVGTLNYPAMKTKCQPFAQELATYVLNPARLLQICDTHGLDLEEYLDILGDQI